MQFRARAAICRGLARLLHTPTHPQKLRQERHVYSPGGVLCDRNGTTLVQYPSGKAGNYAVPDGVINVRDRAFGTCPRLTGITIPDSVISLGHDTLWHCTSLTKVTIGNGVIGIGTRDFCNCTNLSRVSIGNSVTSIGIQAFWYCTRLASLTVPATVTNIASSAFYNCTGRRNLGQRRQSGQAAKFLKRLPGKG